MKIAAICGIILAIQLQARETFLTEEEYQQLEKSVPSYLPEIERAKELEKRINEMEKPRRREKWWELINDAKENPDKQYIEELATIVTSTGRNRKAADSETLRMFYEAQSALTHIPGHAEYYGNRINQATLEAENHNSKETDEDAQKRAYARSELGNIQLYDFPILARLPSPETVRVLGEMLTDERGRMPLEMRKDEPLIHQETWIRRPNSVYAANALATLPLKNKPHAPRAYSDDLEPPKEWINWYRQIKEGRRTFSFEGDPNEYDLNGIVSKVKNPDMPRAAKRPPVADHASAKSSKRPEAVPWPWIAGIAAAILGAISWIILGKRKAI